MERTRFSESDILIQPIDTNLADFSCGDDERYKPLNNFFAKEIERSKLYKYTSTYQVVEKSTNHVLAAFSLANDALILSTEQDRADMIEDMSEDLDLDGQDLLAQLDSFPAINVTHFAVKSEYQSKGLGQIIMSYIIATFTKFYSTSGCQFLVVDALNIPRTNLFYCKLGFEYLTNNDASKSTRRMYYPLIVTSSARGDQQ